eukprot:TRINITY_DN3453_c0_g1_i1.p1 TRINITY_DN3453_c0_g1~~TRINITY_DN3453_c0_g1_i1.p1  ORF type:complete len:513 (+),score=74.84 TRINITY_DN3453_c0_g1_i1:107-1540(+)
MEGSDLINFKTYANAMHILLNGTRDEQIEFAFGMMDTDNSGTVVVEELHAYVRSIFEAVEAVGLKMSDSVTVFEEKIRVLIGDVNGSVTLQQYRDAVKKHTIFFQSLGLLYTSNKNDIANTHSIKGTSLSFGHKDWVLVQTMMLGIRRSVAEVTSLPDRPLKQQDFFRKASYELDQISTSSGQTTWTFRDYAPFVWRKIRDHFGVDSLEYMFSMGPEKILGNLFFLGNLCALCEVVSTARSGSFFFKSSDGKYFVKTLPTDEFGLLQKILPSYYEHVTANNNCLLTRFVGMHSMKCRGTDLAVYFVVMENVFTPGLSIQMQYDLKGSTIDRYVEVDENYDSSIALKDLNFNRKIELGRLKGAFMEQVEKDTRWMAGHNICDYSLLLGIHKIEEGDKDIPEKKNISIFKQAGGGVISSDGTELYFLAIIDNLTVYNYKKTSEKIFKVALYRYDKHQISAMPPLPYQQRFQRYVNTIVQ